VFQDDEINQHSQTSEKLKQQLMEQDEVSLTYFVITPVRVQVTCIPHTC